jgi:ABC-2 type transport system permease protein
MNKLGSLLHAGLKSNFGFAVLWHRIFREKKDRWLIPIMGLSLFGIIPMISGIVIFVQESYRILQPIGQEKALLNMGILAGQAAMLVFGLYYVISALYFSRDLEILIPLPLRPFEVMTSKFAVIVINEYLSVAIFVLPVIITYGVLAQGGPGYWIHAAIVYLVLPVLPLAIVSVLIVAMMRVVNISRKKDIFILMGSMVMLAAVLGFQFLVQQAGNESIHSQNMAVLFSSPDSLLAKIGAWFPPSIWATKAIAGGFSQTGVSHLALLLGTSFLIFIVLILLAERFFYGGVIGLSEASLRRQQLTPDELSHRVSSERRALTAIFIREWRMMNRTPIFLINGVILVILFPLLLALMTRSGHIPSLIMQLSNKPGLMILLSALFMIISCCINGVSSSAFSREGSQFWISKVIPVAPEEQVAAKFLHSCLVSSMGIAAALIVLAFFIHLDAILLITAAGLALITNAFLTAAGMMIDLARPLLDWNNPQKAIKQNLNVMLSMLVNIGFLTLVFFCAKYLIEFQLSDAVILASLNTGMAFLAALSYWALLKFAGKRYQEIEI